MRDIKIIKHAGNIPNKLVHYTAIFFSETIAAVARRIKQSYPPMPRYQTATEFATLNERPILLYFHDNEEKLIFLDRLLACNYYPGIEKKLWLYIGDLRISVDRVVIKTCGRLYRISLYVSIIISGGLNLLEHVGH